MLEIPLPTLLLEVSGMVLLESSISKKGQDKLELVIVVLQLDEEEVLHSVHSMFVTLSSE
jgi:hypothetical protein